MPLGQGGKAVGCAPVSDPALDESFPIAISSDGRSVYVATDEESALSHLTRGADGALAFDSCFSHVDDPACIVNAAMPIGAPREVAVGPDGGSGR